MLNDKYNDCLVKEIREMVMLNIVMIIVAGIIVALLVGAIRRREKENICLHSIVLAIACFAVVGSFVYALPIALDLHNESYIRYDGEYFVESITDTGVVGAISYVKMGDEDSEKYEFKPNPDYWEEGRYNGYIIYSERSKIILEWGGDKIDT